MLGKTGQDPRVLFAVSGPSVHRRPRIWLGGRRQVWSAPVKSSELHRPGWRVCICLCFVSRLFLDKPFLGDFFYLSLVCLSLVHSVFFLLPEHFPQMSFWCILQQLAIRGYYCRLSQLWESPLQGCKRDKLFCESCFSLFAPKSMSELVLPGCPLAHIRSHVPGTKVLTSEHY